jgi:type II protein arginine methyltransferase
LYSQTYYGADEASNVTVFASDWIELDAEDEWVRRDAEFALQQELAYAAYLNIHTVILPPPRSRTHVGSYARAVSATLARHPYIQIGIRIPVYHPGALRNSSSISSSDPNSSVHINFPQETIPGYASDEELNVSWDMWDSVRHICDYNQRLCIGMYPYAQSLSCQMLMVSVLDLTPPLPVIPGVLARWLAEPVRYLYLPSTTFIGNAKGYPVLPKGTQIFIREIMAVSAPRSMHKITI